ncbi:AAC(3) family N-acetyltransferase [Plantactinospora endophytica]|uniref:Aminoglycoside N(3)-acetyltransferase n=1 Tax=Plantactinospora endophytica TaxID=673535 RepID=A0ABQ4E1G4_9ACTN|nr:AAC(3) family N-acetyltransferase [Plantactinospora endophytica]GIG88538.1 AAC(3) family N-acetyltransferase [Plantactinospora endophytica]
MASDRSGPDAAGLAADLGRLGIADTPGILVHSSLRQLGHLPDGAATLFSAIRSAAGPHTTVVVPTHTANNSLSSRDFVTATAGLDRAGVERHIRKMPGFDPAETPSNGMGVFAEYVRRRPDSVRSTHPQTSFAAVGPAAAGWMAVHDSDCHLGERSPLQALYAAGAQVLLLGVGFDRCTAFHLGEYRMGGSVPVREYDCFVQGSSGRQPLRFTDIRLDDGDFEALGADFTRETVVADGRVGAARAMAFPIRAAVDFAARWMRRYRPGSGPADAGAAG